MDFVNKKLLLLLCLFSIGGSKANLFSYIMDMEANKGLHGAADILCEPMLQRKKFEHSIFGQELPRLDGIARLAVNTAVFWQSEVWARKLINRFAPEISQYCMPRFSYFLKIPNLFSREPVTRGSQLRRLPLKDRCKTAGKYIGGTVVLLVAGRAINNAIVSTLNSAYGIVDLVRGVRILRANLVHDVRDIGRRLNPIGDLVNLGGMVARPPILDENPMCSICLQPIGVEFNALRCGHVFHRDCINNWLGIHRTCPMCRAAV